MKNCKRFVYEFANQYLKNPLFPEALKGKIKWAIFYCEQGKISSTEAVEYILHVCKSESEENSYD